MGFRVIFNSFRAISWRCHRGRLAKSCLVSVILIAVLPRVAARPLAEARKKRCFECHFNQLISFGFRNSSFSNGVRNSRELMSAGASQPQPCILGRLHGFAIRSIRCGISKCCHCVMYYRRGSISMALALLGFCAITLAHSACIVGCRVVQVLRGVPVTGFKKSRNEGETSLYGRICASHANCLENLP